MQREISEQKRILTTTQKEKKITIHKLNSLNQIIHQRQVLIHSLGIEIRTVNYELIQKQKYNDSLKHEYDQQKLTLHKTLIKAYKTRKSGREISFVFSSQSISQAMRRWKYLRKISGYRSFQITTILAQATALAKIIKQLEFVKRDKSELMGENKQESKELETDKHSKQILLGELSGREKELREHIRENERAISKLNNEISRLIAKEIDAERKRMARAEASASKVKTEEKEKTSGQKNTGATKETLPKISSKIIGGAFSKNIGSLPWPLEKGFISQTFGVHEHPDLAGITTVNNGIDITSQKGAMASAVFEGTVSAILSIPGQGQAVLVNHGEYFTVYSRLSLVVVQKGQLIRTQQHLGKVMTDEEDKSVLQFQVWHGQEKQNPERWLRNH